MKVRKTGSSIRKKYPLVFATMVAFLSVCTAGVSTFAWFQASAQVQISTASEETTISVRAPDPIAAAFYTYDGNWNGDDGAQTESADTTHTVGYVASSVSGSKVFENVFTPVDISSNTTVSMSTTGLKPGYSLTYCIKLTTASAAIRKASMTMAATTASKSRNRKVYNTSTYVDFGWAINIYSWTVAAAGLTEDVANANLGYFLAHDSENLATGCADKYESSCASPKTSCNLIDGTSSVTTYFFYTLTFDNTDDTYYQYVVPADQTSSGSYIYDSPASDSSDTFWLKTPDGSSDVYEGLEFNITDITIL